MNSSAVLRNVGVPTDLGVGGGGGAVTFLPKTFMHNAKLLKSGCKRTQIAKKQNRSQFPHLKFQNSSIQSLHN